MNKFEFWGQPAPTWRTPIRWLRFKLFEEHRAARHRRVSAEVA